MRRVIPAILIFSFLAACATTRRYDEVLGEWVGKDRTNLIQEWGPPTAIHTYPDGQLAYEYISSNGEHSPEKQGRHLTGYDIGCRTVFVVDSQDIIQGWRREGYDCRIR